MSLSSRYSPSRRSMSRIASATSIATSNIVRALQRLANAAPSRSAASARRSRPAFRRGCPNSSRTMTRSPRALEHRHLAELGDIVHAGVRARIRREDHALVEHYADTVSHAPRFLINRRLLLARFPGYTLFAGEHYEGPDRLRNARGRCPCIGLLPLASAKLPERLAFLLLLALLFLALQLFGTLSFVVRLAGSGLVLVAARLRRLRLRLWRRSGRCDRRVRLDFLGRGSRLRSWRRRQRPCHWRRRGGSRRRTRLGRRCQLRCRLHRRRRRGAWCWCWCNPGFNCAWRHRRMRSNLSGGSRHRQTLRRLGGGAAGCARCSAFPR